MLGILTGLQQEAKLIARFFPHASVALSHATERGAVNALQSLKERGVTQLLSFGCAGGLSPDMSPGTIVVADSVHYNGMNYSTDKMLNMRFGGDKAVRGNILHSATMIAQTQDKQCLFQKTGCSAVDMESGLVACSGLPFSVLRVVCDDAGRDLPPAASEGLRNGGIHIPSLVASLVRHPGQIPALISLGRDAAKARQEMASFLKDL